jgi:hypothetical protein
MAELRNSNFEINAFNSNIGLKDVKANEACLDKEKSIFLDNYVNPKSITSSGNHTSLKFVHTCNHYGIRET